MWDARSFLNEYRSTRKQRRQEALRIFRALTFSLPELIELYRSLPRDRSKLARLLLKEVRERLRRQRLSWQDWFELISEFGLCSWVGKYAQSRFFASLASAHAFETWYRRWTYVTTRPHKYFKDRFQSAPPTLLRRLIEGLFKTATTSKDWRRLYDAPAEYGLRNYPHFPIGADNIRRRAWFYIRSFLC